MLPFLSPAPQPPITFSRVGIIVCGLLLLYCVCPCFSSPLFLAAYLRPQNPVFKIRPNRRPIQRQLPLDNHDPLAAKELENKNAKKKPKAPETKDKAIEPMPDLRIEVDELRERLQALEAAEAMPAKKEQPKVKFLIRYSCPQTRTLRLLDLALANHIAKFLAEHHIRVQRRIRQEMIQRATPAGPALFAPVNYLYYQKTTPVSKELPDEIAARRFVATLLSLGIHVEQPQAMPQHNDCSGLQARARQKLISSPTCAGLFVPTCLCALVWPLEPRISAFPLDGRFPS